MAATMRSRALALEPLLARDVEALRAVPVPVCGVAATHQPGLGAGSLRSA